MIGNSVTGGAIEKSTMLFFDNLPRSARVAVANARFDWTTGPWLRMFEAGQITAKELAARIQRVDQVRSAAERRRIWGPDHPVLRGELANAPRQPKKRARNRRVSK